MVDRCFSLETKISFALTKARPLGRKLSNEMTGES